MNFNTNVNRETVDAILESSLWTKANIKVNKRVDESSDDEGEIGTVAELENVTANTYAEPTDLETLNRDQEDVESFTLDDLQYVLDNLEEDDLMEHAMNMLDVFDVAYEQLSEHSDEGDEDEEEEEEEEEEAEVEAVDERMGAGTYGSNPGRPSDAEKKKPMSPKERRAMLKKKFAANK